MCERMYIYSAIASTCKYTNNFKSAISSKCTYTSSNKSAISSTLTYANKIVQMQVRKN